MSRNSRSLLLSALLSGAAMSGGCISNNYTQVQKEPGRAVYEKAGTLLAPSMTLELALWNGEHSSLNEGPVVKDVFVEGEPIELIIYRKFGNGLMTWKPEGSLIVDLLRNNSVDNSRRNVFHYLGEGHTFGATDWTKKIKYNDLEHGLYTAACTTNSSNPPLFLGKIDFEVVSPPGKVTANKK